MSSLNVMSDSVPSGSDFEAVNQVFSVLLTGLNDSTTYHYQVVATNGQGEQSSTSSAIQSFTTTILRKLHYNASSITKCRFGRDLSVITRISWNRSVNKL